MSNKTDSLWLVSSVSPFTESSPISLCKSKEAADALIDKLTAAVPKGDLTMFSRVPMEDAPSAGFRVSKLASALASFAESF